MIPAVVVIDLCWAGLVTGLYLKAPSIRMRRLTRVVLVYVLIEVLLHQKMEAFVASIWNLLF